MRSDRRRCGYTILELVVVMAALIILGAVVVPTLFGFRGDTRSKAGADMVRGLMAEARAKAMEGGTPYRLAISQDNKRIRLAPDTLEATGAAPTTEEEGGSLVREDDLPESVSATVLLDENDEASTQDTAGWVRAATFLPDGTCKEDTIEVEIREPGAVPYVVRLRGLTGAVSVVRSKSAATPGGTR